jgi:HSP20 family protein
MHIKDLIHRNRNDNKFLIDSPQSSIEREMNQFFREFPQSFFGELPFRMDTAHPFLAVPNVDVMEKEDVILVTADLPGMKEKDVDVSVYENILTIKGEKKQEKEEKSKNYCCKERSFGEFKRNIVLPAEIDPENIDATIKHGVLSVTLKKTKAEQKKQKNINVKAG